MTIVMLVLAVAMWAESPPPAPKDGQSRQPRKTRILPRLAVSTEPFRHYARTSCPIVKLSRLSTCT